MAELKTKQKKVRVLNQKGKVFRQQDPLLAVVQWGVHHMVRAFVCVFVCVWVAGWVAGWLGGWVGKEGGGSGYGWVVGRERVSVCV